MNHNHPDYLRCSGKLFRCVAANHSFQVPGQRQPPVRTDSESIRDEKVKVLKAMSAPSSSQRTWGGLSLERVTPPGGWQNPREPRENPMKSISCR